MGNFLLRDPMGAFISLYYLPGKIAMTSTGHVADIAAKNIYTILVQKPKSCWAKLRFLKG
jgi:hypothetical protein